MMQQVVKQAKALPEDGGVILLQQVAGLVVNGDAIGVDLFFEVGSVTQSVQWHQQPAITQPDNTAAGGELFFFIY